MQSTEKEIVVLLEDQENALLIVQTYLLHELYELVHIATFEAALTFITQVSRTEAERIAAVIVDGCISETPKLDNQGEYLIGLLRENPALAHVYIVSNSAGAELSGAHIHLKKRLQLIKAHLAGLPQLIATHREVEGKNWKEKIQN